MAVNDDVSGGQDEGHLTPDLSTVCGEMFEEMIPHNEIIPLGASLLVLLSQSLSLGCKVHT